MLKRRIHRTSATDLAPYEKLWILRMLVALGGHKQFIHHSGFMQDHVAAALGLLDPAQEDREDDSKFDARKVLQRLKRMHRSAEAAAHKIAFPEPLAGNLAGLGAAVGATAADQAILGFGACIHTSRILDDTADTLGSMNHARLVRTLAEVLDLSEQGIRAALSPTGLLARTGLLTVDGSNMALRGKLDLLHSRLADSLLSYRSDAEGLLRGRVEPARPAELTIADYTHLRKDLDLLLPFLKHAIEARRKGVNIRLLGPPGVGKTQLVLAIGQALGRKVFEVSSEDEGGKALDAINRLRALGAAHSFFGKSGGIVLFDEIEDVFNDGDGFFGFQKSTAQKHKHLINRGLEENPLPTFWLTNSTQRMDPAFVRRFSMLIDVPVPPKSRRVEILTRSCSEVVSTKGIAQLAESDQLAPAVVDSAVSVVRAISDGLTIDCRTEAVQRLVNATLKAQGHRTIKGRDASSLPEVYDPAFIKSDCDIAEVIEGIVRSRSGRLCFYGRPGTGKTAAGRYLAERLGVPLLARKCSDLVAPWVGMTERNIAASFEDAERESAVLLIDEVDSFLRDRRQAERSWEVTQVNEMLTQMEGFAGVFIASTNLMDGIDQAALRRFDLKVKFDYLDADQAVRLFLRHCEHLGIPVEIHKDVPRVSGLRNLAPGDFAAVVRQHRFRPIASGTAFITSLEGECAMKEPVARSIGFVA